ncbi:hypothetical protein FHT00_000721 [Sphingomonas insulae]|nr:hypothetical protein [Sphingomonas insulae]
MKTGEVGFHRLRPHAIATFGEAKNIASIDRPVVAKLMTQLVGIGDILMNGKQRGKRDEARFGMTGQSVAPCPIHAMSPGAIRPPSESPAENWRDLRLQSTRNGHISNIFYFIFMTQQILLAMLIRY